MSGLAAPQDVVAALYRVADDTMLPWLDELMITAGLLRRCACGSTAPADERCDHCGLTDEPDVLSYFEVYRCEPEATFTVPALAKGDPPLQVRIAAAGGGTIGRAYANNDWIYDVVLADTLVCSGADLHSGGVPHTHAQMAAVLAEHLANTSQPLLHAHRERLALWASQALARGGRRG
ncbi:hypothetical protein EDC02_7703 [Micromonospora sp. Llam0]|uniref:hypothetical protein n=1 Tax=Micromonospora sp. Llam0 TaxID=2485143 RepID=UPI000F4AA97A|nr:hypothetical protein [Micromonospora sp. Llam0]ROO52762.1 hypothetical protein EDC02_7703 [Micromonospora sp. Llam0]